MLSASWTYETCSKKLYLLAKAQFSLVCSSLTPAVSRGQTHTLIKRMYMEAALRLFAYFPYLNTDAVLDS